MLKKSASPEKVEAQAKVEAKKRTSDLRSTLTSTSAYLLAAALLDDLFEHPAHGSPICVQLRTGLPVRARE
jgi:hypothetical protein